MNKEDVTLLAHPEPPLLSSNRTGGSHILSRATGLLGVGMVFWARVYL